MRLSDRIDLPSRVLRSVASSYVGFGVHAVTGLLLTPYVLHQLGAERFGVWVLLTSMLGYFQILELGIMPAVVRYVSHYRAHAEHEELDAVIGSALLLVVGLAGVTVPLVGVVAWLAPNVFQLPQSDHRLLAQGIALVGLAAVVTFFRRLVTAVLEGFQQFPLLNLCTGTGSVLAAVASVVVLRQGHGVVALLAVSTLQLMFEGLFMLAILHRLFHVRANPWRSRRATIRLLLGYSSWTFVSDISLAVSHRLDAVMIGLFLPGTAITSFNLGIRIPRMIETVADPLIATFFPLASAMHREPTRASLSRLLISGTRLSLLLTTPGLVLAAWHGSDLIRWWLGAEYVAESLPIFLIFLGVIFLSLLEATAARILLGTGEVRFDAGVSAMSAFLNLTLSFFLVQSHGIVGIAIGTIVPTFVGKVLFSIPYTCSITSTPRLQFAVRTLIPAGCVAAATLAFMAITEGWFRNEYTAFGAHFLFAGLVALAAILTARPHPVGAPVTALPAATGSE